MITFTKPFEQHDYMETISLHGTDDRLYQLVARLVMNPDVLRWNNNYPFRTSPQYTWHLCMTDGGVAGFMPVKNTAGGLYLDNYYVANDDREVLEALISHILSTSDKSVTVLSHKRHTEVFRRHGFVTITVFAQYDKLQRVSGKGDRSQ